MQPAHADPDRIEPASPAGEVGLAQRAVPRGMLQQLLAADNETAHRQTVLSLVRANGFDAMCYGRLRPVGAAAWVWQVEAWYGIECAGQGDVPVQVNDAQRDPRLAPALRSCLPVFWSEDDFPPDTAGANAAWHAEGYRSGATLALTGPAAGERSVVVLLSHRPHSGRDIDDACFGRVLVLGLGVHDHHTRHRSGTASERRPAPGNADGLSARQREVLRCLALGLADKQIADRLDLSLHTVDYHMRQLRKHFGARNRLQLTRLWESAMGAKPKAGPATGLAGESTGAPVTDALATDVPATELQAMTLSRPPAISHSISLSAG